MLKIKDNIDLKELKKFGFIKANFQYELNKCKNKKTEFDGYGVDLDTKQIHNYAVEDNTIDILYDLIKADLVEKVEE